MKRPQRKILRKTSPRGVRPQGALDLVEEAIGLLRVTPTLLAPYLIGSLPFMLALLYFWSDMLRSPFAPRHVAETSLGMAVLFFWMKSWQAVFVQQVLARVRAVPAPQWPLGRIWRLVTAQIIYQPWGFVVLPAALLVTLPFPWLYAFYQNLSVYGHGDETRARQHAWQQAKLWPKQNLIVIWLLSPWLLVLAGGLIVVGMPLIGTLEHGSWWLGLVVLFLAALIPLNPIGMVIAVNLAGAIMMLPWLAKTLFGIESIFTLSSRGVVNTTFVAIVYALAYLCLDPIVKVVYALRCFYGESVRTGEDLKVALRAIRQTMALLVCAATVCCGLWLATPVLAELTPWPPLLKREGGQDSPRPLGEGLGVRVLPLSFQERGPGGEFLLGWQPFLTIPVLAQEAATEVPASAETSSAPVSSQELEESLKHVLSQAEYSWRLPRDRVNVENSEERDLHPALQWMADALDGLGETLRNWGKTLKRWGKNVRNWWRDLFPKSSPDSPRGRSRGDWMPGVQALVFLLLAAIASVLAVLLWRFFKQRRRVETTVVAEETAARPDLTHADVDARALPEDGWLSMARELLEKGQMRLALRALYLATLACLAERELITIARFKSDRDYARELDRRAHALPDIPPVFAENMLAFQRAWYGMYAVDQAGIDQFTANYRKLKTAAP